MRVDSTSPGCHAEWSKAVLQVLAAQESLKLGSISELSSAVDIARLPLSFSFSALLSPNTPSNLPLIIHNRGPMHSTHLICLALNEECRLLKKGTFYFLPVGNLPAGRPCDMVFVDELWGEHGNKVWDTSNWLARLNMLDAGKSCNDALDGC